MTNTLREPAFRKLSQELQGILTSAQTASSEEKTAGYWNVGARIARERLSEEAGYDRAVLKEVADAIGVSARTLQHAVVLHAAYDAPPAGPLTWAHYRLLAPLSTKKERSFYSKKAIADSWSVRDLAASIRADLFGGGSLTDPRIERPTAPTYVYGAASPRLVDADTFDVDIDLGFQCWTKKRIRLAHIDCPEAGTKGGRAARNFVHAHLSRARTLAIRTQKVDLHGRYIGDIFVSPQEVSLEDCYLEGLHLNAAIVAAGHGVVIA